MHVSVPRLFLREIVIAYYYFSALINTLFVLFNRIIDALFGKLARNLNALHFPYETSETIRFYYQQLARMNFSPYLKKLRS